jgi:nitrile hydratase
MPDDGHHHHHQHEHGQPEIALRVEAIESLLTEKGLIDPATVDEIIRFYEQDIGPLNGAKVVARAWTDPAYKAHLLSDPDAAIAAMGLGGPEAARLVVVENEQNVHNVVVCTLCSCYPWAVLGLPPSWYKSPAYRSRIVREPRKVLREMGLELPEDVEIRVWDSSAEVRYLVLPQRPDGTELLTAEQLAGLVTRDAMIGTARVQAPKAP